MAKEHYLVEWREFRKMTQTQLAEKIGTAPGVISLLENGKRQLSPKWLTKLAEALGTRPGHIIDHDPNQVDADIFDIWMAIGERDRVRAARMLRALRDTGTD